MTSDEAGPVLMILARLEAGQAAILAEQTAILAGQASINRRLDEFAARMDSFEARLAAIEARLEALFGRQTALEATFAALKSGQDRLRADLMERMDRLQHAIDLVKDDITVNYGSADTALRIAKGASEEVRGLVEMLSTMRRQIMRLQTDVEQLRDGRAAS